MQQNYIFSLIPMTLDRDASHWPLGRYLHYETLLLEINYGHKSSTLPPQLTKETSNVQEKPLTLEVDGFSSLLV